MAKKKAAKKAIKKKAAKKAPTYRTQKVLMRTHGGQWLEWAAWHLEPLEVGAPITHVGWHTIADHPVTQPPWTDQYDRWVKMEWLGDDEPYDLF